MDALGSGRYADRMSQRGVPAQPTKLAFVPRRRVSRRDVD